METYKGPKKPTDLGQEFIESGMRLITQQSADKYLRDIEDTKDEPKDTPS